MAEHIQMYVDVKDVWPIGTPPGAFEITQHTLQGRSSVCAHIKFVCPNRRHCAVFLGRQFEAKRVENEPNVWAWDGNVEKPTITPSINCIAEKDGKPTGGCGWHGFITNGELS